MGRHSRGGPFRLVLVTSTVLACSAVSLLGSSDHPQTGRASVAAREIAYVDRIADDETDPDTAWMPDSGD